MDSEVETEEVVEVETEEVSEVAEVETEEASEEAEVETEEAEEVEEVETEEAEVVEEVRLRFYIHPGGRGGIGMRGGMATIVEPHEQFPGKLFLA